jgi:hypothetical protein
MSAVPTSISVSIDLEEYSKFESERNTIYVSWTASAGSSMLNEVLTLQLTKSRRNRDAVVFTTDIMIVSTDPTVSGVVAIKLLDVVDSTMINKIRRGLYFIKIFSKTIPLIYADSVDFLISIITAQGLRGSELWGLPMTANKVPMVLFQPKNVTGVEVVSLSADHPAHFFTLTHVYDSAPLIHQLSWGAGPLVSITAPGTYLLKFDCNGTDYIIVHVRSISALPTSNSTDELLVEKSKISDTMLRRWIEEACDWWENDKVSVFLEPTRVVTTVELANNPTVDWDFIAKGITFFPTIPCKWIDILFPYPSLLKIDDLFGNVANTRVVDIDLHWVEISEKNGFVQLVPFNTTSAFRFIGLIWVGQLTGSMDIPNFWNFNLVAGMRNIDPVVYQILCKRAACDALTVAGQAFRLGLSSQSLSRDGVSESVSYTSSAVYGVFGATIEDYRKFIDKEIKYLRGRYRGLNMVVL